jgi:DNA-binding NarL/FixJ family response regulator
MRRASGQASKTVRGYSPRPGLLAGSRSETASRARAVSPVPKVVVVTMFENPRYLRELMRLGASAYLIKSASTRHLIGAIRAAVFDPKGENVVVGMPREMLEATRKALQEEWITVSDVADDLE